MKIRAKDSIWEDDSKTITPYNEGEVEAYNPPTRPFLLLLLHLPFFFSHVDIIHNADWAQLAFSHSPAFQINV